MRQQLIQDLKKERETRRKENLQRSMELRKQNKGQLRSSEEYLFFRMQKDFKDRQANISSEFRHRQEELKEHFSTQAVRVH